jgi:hypothetical protein
VTVVPIDARRITDEGSFHDVFAEAFGFPGFYGRNMNAWIDCMGCMHDPDASLATVGVPAGEVCVIRLTHAADFAARCPAQYAALVECTAFVNWRNLNGGAMIALAFYD